MSYIQRALDFLIAQPAWRYHPRSQPASEPTALAALALAAYGYSENAKRARQWLAAAQAPDGRVGVRQGEDGPGWPTALAVLAWNLTTATPQHVSTIRPDDPPFLAESARAVAWLLAISGETSAQPDYTGHDTTIAGWPWVSGTHSWVEPTAMSLLALRSAGLVAHPRAREGARLLEDRLLTSGGCNYGNTVVLGQTLLAHVEPTGLALMALAGEPVRTERVELALEYLEQTLGPTTTSASLAYGLLGLAAYRQQPRECDAWIAGCVARSLRRESSLELALLALAALGTDCPLLHLPAFSAAV